MGEVEDKKGDDGDNDEDEEELKRERMMKRREWENQS